MLNANDFIKEDITDKLIFPYIFFQQENVEQKIILANYIKRLDFVSLLLPSSTCFSYDSIVAGLSEKHIEFITNNAPMNYKKSILESLSKKYKIDEIFEIAKVMDEDLGSNSTQNQNRVRNVIRYIKDNLPAFQF